MARNIADILKNGNSIEKGRQLVPALGLAKRDDYRRSPRVNSKSMAQQMATGMLNNQFSIVVVGSVWPGLRG